MNMTVPAVTMVPDSITENVSLLAQKDTSLLVDNVTKSAMSVMLPV
jgi:hypothetical protein